MIDKTISMMMSLTSASF